MIPGTKTTIRVISENPEAPEVAGVWAVTILRSFFYRASQSRDIVDIQIAAGAALQDLDELQGFARYEEPMEGLAT